MKGCYVAESQRMASHTVQDRGRCRPPMGKPAWRKDVTSCKGREPLTLRLPPRVGTAWFCRCRLGICHGLTLLQKTPAHIHLQAQRTMVGPCMPNPRKHPSLLIILPSEPSLTMLSSDILMAIRFRPGPRVRHQRLSHTFLLNLQVTDVRTLPFMLCTMRDLKQVVNFVLADTL